MKCFSMLKGEIKHDIFRDSLSFYKIVSRSIVLLVSIMIFLSSTKGLNAVNDISAGKCPKAFSAKIGGVDVRFGDLEFIDDDGLFGLGVFSNGYCCPLNTDRLKAHLPGTNPACQYTSTGEFTWGSQESNSNFCPEDSVLIGAAGGADNKCQRFFESFRGMFFLGCSNEVDWKFQKYTNYSAGTVQTETLDLGFCKEADAISAPADHDCICAAHLATGNTGKSDISQNPGGKTCTEFCDDGDPATQDVFKDGSGISGGGALSNDPVGCNVNGSTTPPFDGVWTAIGCIPTESSALTNWAVLFGMAIGTLLSVAKIVQGSIMIMTGTGNPDKLQEGKSTITAAVIGLIVIFSAVLLLYALGMDILDLDRFGFTTTIVP